MSRFDAITNANHLAAAIVVEEFVRCGVTTFCVAPGSRSTPLAWAVAEHPKANAIVHHEERGLAFCALGIAKATRVPAPVICTSGTAVANLVPAVVEASQSRVPMILLTADRPPELIDCGANQTIEQDKIFGEYVRWRHTLCTLMQDAGEDGVAPAQALLTAVDHAYATANGASPGPVHLNCPFRKPLEPEGDFSPGYGYWGRAREWRRSPDPYTVVDAHVEPEPDSLPPVSQQAVDVTMRNLLVVGQLDTESERRSATHLAARLGWPVIADVTSGLRTVDALPNILRLPHLAAGAVHDADMLLQVGGAFTLQRTLEAVLAASPRVRHVRAQAHGVRLDPLHSFGHRMRASVEEVAGVADAFNAAPIDSDWAEAIFDADRAAVEVFEDTIAPAGLTEVGAVCAVGRALPEGGTLFLGNSMPIRDADMYAWRVPSRTRVYANRGASGIDGNIGTITGLASADPRPTSAVIGDLAFLHDAPSLAMLRGTDVPIALVVINNDGGGIFSMLPIAEHEKHFERYFGTPHGLSPAGIAVGFDLAAARPGTLAELESTLDAALTTPGATVIEVNTNRAENAALHADLRRALEPRPPKP